VQAGGAESYESITMAFQIKADESVAQGVRRMARNQIDRALDGLTGRSGAEPEEVVHGARKRFKKVRAVLRLMRDALGRKVYRRDNSRFRDAGRPLSEVRDAGVLVETLDQLIERYGDQGRPEVIGSARERLLRRKREVYQRVLDEGDALAKVARAMEEARGDVKRWEVAGDDWEALEGGLKGIYGRGHRAFHEALESRTDENLHEWRKRVKDLWYVMDLLKPIRPGFTEGRGEEAHKLADDLGDDHDLAVLRQVLSDPKDRLGVHSAGGVIVPLIDRRRAELQQDAFTLGRRLYGERPKLFVARLGAYWRAWRSEIEAARFDPT
jgi:CHAD domain-containing protein